MSSLQRTPPAFSGVNNNTPLTNKRLRTDEQSWENAVSAKCDVASNPKTMEDLMRTMMQQFAETRELITTVRSEIHDVHIKIDTVKMELQSDIASVKNEYATKFQQHDSALESLNRMVDCVSQKVGALENRNELIISGIPFQTGEDLNSTLNAISRHLEVKDTSALVAKTRRITSASNSDRTGLILVEFALKSSRDEFYSAYLRKRDLKLKHLGLDSDRRVYINESLTTEQRKLKSTALHLKKAGKLVSVYTKQGIVYVKAAANGPPIEINSERELASFS